VGQQEPVAESAAAEEVVAAGELVPESVQVSVLA